jgi:predicted RNase H-like nuclease (RuvC/YqgF family)
LIRIAALVTGACLVLAAPGMAEEAAGGKSADQLQDAIARIREKVEAQRAETGSAARDAAAQAVETDQLAQRVADLESENARLQAANRQLSRDLDEAQRKAARQEQEKDALAKVASAKLEEITSTTRQLASARAEIDHISRVLTGLEAGRAVLSAGAQDKPLLVTGASTSGRDEADRLRAELDRAKARIAELEAEAP